MLQWGCLNWAKSQIFCVKCLAQEIQAQPLSCYTDPAMETFHVSSTLPLPDSSQETGIYLMQGTQRSREVGSNFSSATGAVWLGLSVQLCQASLLEVLGREDTVSLKTRSPQKMPPVPAACPASELGVRITSMPTFVSSAPSCLFPPLGQGLGLCGITGA